MRWRVSRVIDTRMRKLSEKSCNPRFPWKVTPNADRSANRDGGAGRVGHRRRRFRSAAQPWIDRCRQAPGCTRGPRSGAAGRDPPRRAPPESRVGFDRDLHPARQRDRTLSRCVPQQGHGGAPRRIGSDACSQCARCRRSPRPIASGAQSGLPRRGIDGIHRDRLSRLQHHEAARRFFLAEPLLWLAAGRTGCGHPVGLARLLLRAVARQRIVPPAGIRLPGRPRIASNWQSGSARRM